jgi:hypothetical protein
MTWLQRNAMKTTAVMDEKGVNLLVWESGRS